VGHEIDDVITYASLAFKENFHLQNTKALNLGFGSWWFSPDTYFITKKNIQWAG
jgi:hypothetical protein